MAESDLAPSTADFKLAGTTAIVRLASVIDAKPAEIVAALRSYVMPGASDAEMFALCIVAAETRLNPLKKEIYAFKTKAKVKDANGAERWVERFVPLIGVDGWLTIANRHPGFDGFGEFTFEYEGSRILSCSTTCHVKGRAHNPRVVAFMDECVMDTEPWRKRPHQMMRWAAMKLAVRISLGYGYVLDSEDAEREPMSVMRDPMLASIAAPATKAKALQQRLDSLPPRKPNYQSKPMPNKVEEPASLDDIDHTFDDGIFPDDDAATKDLIVPGDERDVPPSPSTPAPADPADAEVSRLARELAQLDAIEGFNPPVIEVRRSAEREAKKRECTAVEVLRDRIRIAKARMPPKATATAP